MKADPTQVSALVDVVEGTREYPNLKSLHSAAMMDLEEMAATEEKAIEERKAAKAKADAAKAEEEKRKQDEERKKSKEANEGGRRVVSETGPKEAHNAKR